MEGRCFALRRHRWLVTENFESTTRLDAVEEITQGGETKRIQYQEVVGYGLAVSLDTVDDLLNENLAVFDHTAYMAREAKRRCPRRRLTAVDFEAAPVPLRLTPLPAALLPGRLT